MPLQINQLPPDMRSLPERVKLLERALREFAAARRLEHADVGGTSLQATTDGRLLLGGAVRINGDLDVGGTVTVGGSRQTASIRDWLNVLDYGAIGDGVTDNITAIQNAINTAAGQGGGTVYLPYGIYRTSDALVLKSGVTLRGPHATGWPGRFPTSLCSIKLTSTFAGECAISILGSDITGAGSNEGNVQILDLDLDGSALPAGSVSGIHAQGEAMSVTLRRVTIKQMTHNGVHSNVGTGARAPHDWFMDTVVAFQCGGYGFSMSMTDGYLRDCIASTNGNDGYLLGPFGSLDMAGCQALFNGGHGLNIAGGSQVGNLTVASFVTDRNHSDGIHLGASTGIASPPLIFSGITCNRDGKNSNTGGGGYAGFAAVGCANPIIITGLVTNTGVDDSGAGVNSPQYGANFSGNAYVSVASGYLHGDTTGWRDDGTNTVIRRGLNVGEATGPKATPTFVYTNGVRSTDGLINANNIALFTPSATLPAVDLTTNNAAGTGVRVTNQIAGASGMSIINAAATDIALSARQSGDAFSRVRLGADGALSMGPGAATRDTNLYRSAAGVLQTDNSFYSVGPSLGIPTAQAHGAIAFSVDPRAVRADKLLTAGTLYLAAVYVPRAVTATKLGWGINTAGVGPVTGQNFVGLYSSAGVQLASVGVDARITTTGPFTETINAALTPGQYWVAFLLNAATMPRLYVGGDLSGSLLNWNVTAATLTFATNGTALTALPASITPASNAVSQACLFAGLA